MDPYNAASSALVSIPDHVSVDLSVHPPHLSNFSSLDNELQNYTLQTAAVQGPAAASWEISPTSSTSSSSIKLKRRLLKRTPDLANKRQKVVQMAKTPITTVPTAPQIGLNLVDNAQPRPQPPQLHIPLPNAPRDSRSASSASEGSPDQQTRKRCEEWGRKQQAHRWTGSSLSSWPKKDLFESRRGRWEGRSHQSRENVRPLVVDSYRPSRSRERRML